MAYELYLSCEKKCYIPSYHTTHTLQDTTAKFVHVILDLVIFSYAPIVGSNMAKTLALMIGTRSTIFFFFTFFLLPDFYLNTFENSLEVTKRNIII